MKRTVLYRGKAESRGQATLVASAGNSGFLNDQEGQNLGLSPSYNKLE